MSTHRATRGGNSYFPLPTTRLYPFLFFLVFTLGFFPTLIATPPELPPYGISSPESIGKFINGNLPNNTPTAGSGTVTSWKVENAFPNIDFIDPLDLRDYPGRNKFLLAGKNGQIWTFDKNPNVSSRTLFLDISNRTRTAGDCGVLGVIFHPEFGQSGSPNSRYFYVYYRYTQQKGRSDHLAYVRLSRFQVRAGQDIADPQSEYVMIQQYDRHDWHNGGSMFFHPQNKFLYLIIGDEGGAYDEFNSGQRINHSLFGGILRIDVDRRGGNISHPIRRQPRPPVNPPSGWPGTFSQGYYIPNDNPWVNPNGSVLEEFWAIGTRSPHRMYYDAPTGDIWFGDIGQGAREEISIVHKGDNAQWPYKEGFRDGFKPRPGNLIGRDTPPLLDYPRSDGSSVIGGIVYRGSKWANSLGGKYIFSDNVVQNIWTVDYYNSGSNQKRKITQIPFVTNNWKDGVSHIYEDEAGDVYILQLAGHNRPGGRIYKLAPQSQTGGGNPAPARLSQVGAFSNLSNMTPIQGVIPFEPNVTFWSDGARKRRWIALPNNGSHNTAAEKIQYSQNGDWTFPSGTVFIKHFDLPVDDRNPNITRKIETRFTVKGDNGQFYFLTYRWRDNQSDADLVTSAQNRNITIQTSSGTRTQVWHYPSNSECVTCHNSSSKQVLGMNTRQINGEMRYPKSGITANQLATMNNLNWFNQTLNEGQFGSWPTVHPANDNSASLEERGMSYLDVNCGYCHRPGALQTSFDLRFTTPLANQGIINVNPGNTLGISGAKLILPGDPGKSIIYQRLISLHEGVMMPPLAKNVLDVEGRNLIRDWINGMSGPTDNQAPSVPQNLSASQITANSVRLTWNASSDNVGVSGYQIFQNGTPGAIQSVTSNQVTLSGLTPNTTYFFAVAAFDAAGNTSAQSGAVEVTTSGQSSGDCTSPYNLALNKSTSQSSTKSAGASSLAVDGNLNGAGGPHGPGASISHTQDESQAWWQVDLGQASDIDEVSIYNRTDCCGYRLKQFYIFASNQPFSNSASLNDLINDGQISKVYYSGTLGNQGTIGFSATGRYVRIQLTGPTDPLHMAEVQVMGCPSDGGGQPGDPCQGKPSVSIANAGPFTSDQGVQQLQGSPAGGTWSGDVPANGRFNPGQGPGTYSVSYTVDLGDGCTKTANATIQVNTPNPGGGGECNSPYNMALNKSAQLSSTYGLGTADLAVDGNTNGSTPWGANPNLAHSQNESQPWWQVDLGEQANISQVRVFNRTDCCQNRLKDFYVLVSSQPFSASASLSSLLNTPGITSQFVSGNAGAPSNVSISATGRYVRVQLNANSQTMNLAEVEVMACPSDGGGQPGDPCQGKPSVSIANAGPFTSDQGVQQLQGSPAGGTWSGDVPANGRFNPGQGPGTYSVSYTVDLGDGCTKTANATIQVNAPNPGGGGECNSPYNMALNKSAQLSSTYGLGTADLAVDGNTNGSTPWGANPNLAHSQNESQPWWQVDLGQQANISQVRVFNRTDCCQNRLKDFYILVSSQPFSASASLSSLLNTPGITSQFVSGNAGAPSNVSISATGRYVRIQLNATSQTMNLAEVEVMACPSDGGGQPGDPCQGKPSVSIANSGPFTSDQGIQQLQGSPAGGTWSGDVPANGRFNPGQGPGTYSVSYTVDLGDGCTKTANATIQVNAPNPGGGGECNSPYNMALNKSAQLSSTYGLGTADLAVDGNTAGSTPWGANPNLAHTQNESQPWWQVDLGQQANISQVRVFNRTDCCQNRLKDFYVLVSSQPFSASASLSTLLNTPGITSQFISGNASRPSDVSLSAAGRYVRVQLNANSQSMHLAEVEVMACPSNNNSSQSRRTSDVRNLGDLDKNPAFNESDFSLLTLSVTPNPFKGEFRLYSSQMVSEPLSITVFSTLGQTVFQGVWEPSSYEMTVNARDWSQGVYLLKLGNSDKPKIIKLIKN